MAIEALVRTATSESNPRLRANAVGCLRHSKAPADRMVPIGLRFIRSEDGYDRWHAAQLLAQYIAVDDKAHEALEGALNDSDNPVRLTATNALRRQRPAGRSR